jgi:uncharacterized protein YmfQ (DUF2313 family)
MMREELISNLHKIMRMDPFINEICTFAGLSMDNVEATMNDLEAQYWVDTATWGLTIWEKLLAISTVSTDIDIRRSVILAKLRGGGKADLELLQAVADSWKNGEIAVTFVAGVINVAFVGVYGIPTDIDSLKSALEDIKPAHLAIVYAFLYTQWSKVKTISWNTVKTKSWDSLLNGGTV